MNNSSRKILLVASHGGHWVQMRKLVAAFEGMNLYYVSTTSEVAGEVAPAPVSVVPDANLSEKARLVLLALKMFRVVAEIRPDFVLSTGAAPGFFALLFGRWFGARTIWVDSLANAERLSRSGQKAGAFADLWLTQWPELARANGPLFRGSVL